VPLMASLARAFTYVIAAQIQVVGFIFLAYWVGDWLNKSHPASFSWYWVTGVIGGLCSIQTFYVVIKAAMSAGKSS
jgi:hypothetical protein